MKMLRINHENLIDLLYLGNLCDQLHAQDVINRRQLKFISSRSTDPDKIEALLDIIRRFSLRQYKTTINCLLASKQRHIAKILSVGGVVIAVHVHLEKDFDEDEEEIATAITNLIDKRPASRILELLRLKLIAAKRGQSVILYFHCLALADKTRLHDMVVDDRLRIIVEETFRSFLPEQKKSVKVTLRCSEDDFKEDENDAHLKMSWGKVLISWKNWTKCQNETITVIQNITAAVKERFISIGEVDSDIVSLVCHEMERDENLKCLPLKFLKVMGKDEECYKIMIEKSREFLKMVKSEEKYNKPAYMIFSDELFNRIAKLQLDSTAGQTTTDPTVGEPVPCSLSEFETACNGEEGGQLSKLIRTLDHFGEEVGETEEAREGKSFVLIKSFLRKIMETSGPNGMIDALEDIVRTLREERDNLFMAISESITALQTVTSNISNSTEQLRNDISIWSAKRKETMSKIIKIIIKLNETTKNVAIAQTVGSSVGLVGGGLAIGGLIAAPFTLGTSLPPAILGLIIAFLGGTTTAGAIVAETVIDRQEMEKAAECLKEDIILFDSVVDQIKSVNRNSILLLQYIPEDQLEDFIFVIFHPESKLISNVQFDPKIAVSVARMVAVGGKTISISITLSRLAIAGAIGAARMAGLVLGHIFAAFGVVLDVGTIAYNAYKLDKGAKSDSAAELEKILVKMEEEKEGIDGCLKEINAAANSKKNLVKIEEGKEGIDGCLKEINGAANLEKIL